MKYIITYLILSTLIFSNIDDSIRLRLKDLSKFKKKYDIDLMPINDPDKIKSETYLFEAQIDEIKRNANNFINKPVQDNDLVIMETSRGLLKIKLFPHVAPNHCNNFKKLANSGFYDETGFHRVIPGFMIQGGDINTRDGNPTNDGRGSPGWTVDAEFSDITHVRGVLSMARSSDINSAGSQFFICVADAPHLDGKYTVFGEVIENHHVIDKIVNSATDYSTAKRKCIISIPNNSTDVWIKVSDPKDRKYLYCEVPSGEDKDTYKRNIQNMLSSDRPLSLPRINKVRVVDE